MNEETRQTHWNLCKNAFNIKMFLLQIKNVTGWRRTHELVKEKESQIA